MKEFNDIDKIYNIVSKKNDKFNRDSSKKTTSFKLITKMFENKDKYLKAIPFDCEIQSTVYYDLYNTIDLLEFNNLILI